MLIALFERACLVAYKEDMASAESRNSWDDFMREWSRRDDFQDALPRLLRGDDPCFRRCIERVAFEERGTSQLSP